MNVTSRKIPAFALQEMIVVLLITAIVVGMAFSVLRLVQRQMGSIQNIYEVKLEADKLRQSLWVDFNRYSSVYYNEEENRLYFSNELEMKHYGIEDNRMVTEKDTFNIEIASKICYFNNNEITSGEIDAFEIQTSKQTGQQRLFVYKDNAAATYMNR